MSLTFSNFKAVETANTRDNSHLVHAKGQSFNFKYKKFYGKDKEKVQIISSSFTIANDIFAKLDLDNKALIEIVSPENVSYLAVVDNDNGVFLKHTKKNKSGVKGKVFKSTLLEKSLGEQGIIDVNAIGTTQKLDLVLVEGSETAYIGEQGKGFQSYGVYQIVKAADSELTEEEKAEDAKGEDTTVEPTPTDSTVVSETANQAAPTANDDDF